MGAYDKYVEAYRQDRNLKIAAQKVGIPWQTLYVYLRKAGEPVVGDKTRYGSDSDKLAAAAEREFVRLVPFARDLNRKTFQAKVDFDVLGYGVDVKASALRKSNKACKVRRWAYSIKKQEAIADFFVCLGIGDSGDIASALLIPGEIARHYTTISLSETGGKWAEYEVSPSDISKFFLDLGEKP